MIKWIVFVCSPYPESDGRSSCDNAFAWPIWSSQVCSARFNVHFLLYFPCCSSWFSLSLLMLKYSKKSFCLEHTKFYIVIKVNAHTHTEVCHAHNNNHYHREQSSWARRLKPLLVCASFVVLDRPIGSRAVPAWATVQDVLPWLDRCSCSWPGPGVFN